MTCVYEILSLILSNKRSEYKGKLLVGRIKYGSKSWVKETYKQKIKLHRISQQRSISPKYFKI